MKNRPEYKQPRTDGQMRSEFSENSILILAALHGGLFPAD